MEGVVVARFNKSRSASRVIRNTPHNVDNAGFAVLTVEGTLWPAQYLDAFHIVKIHILHE